MIDTSVALALERLELASLPAEVAISSLTLAELTVGPYATTSALERGRRQELLQRIESSIEALDFDPRCARAYGPIYGATRSMGRKARGARAVDLMIAATARGYELPLYTLNGADLRGLDGLVEVVDLAQ